MLTIIYDPTAPSIADQYAEDKILELCKNGVNEYRTSTDSVILAARVLTVEGKIPKPRFVYQGAEVEMEEKYMKPINGYPKEFANARDNLLTRIIKHQFEKAKEGK